MPSLEWETAVKRAAAFVDEAPQWPSGIVCRLPQSADADLNGNVQLLTAEGWELAGWQDVVVGLGWQHTPIWWLLQNPSGTGIGMKRP